MTLADVRAVRFDAPLRVGGPGASRYMARLVFGGQVLWSCRHEHDAIGFARRCGFLAWTRLRDWLEEARP